MTTNDDWVRISEVFGQAIELAPEHREAFLDDACANSSSIRVEVARLLKLHATDDVFLEPPNALTGSFSVEQFPSAGRAMTGRSIGRYRITRAIAAGGMGMVFEAEQESPRRRVALKIVHPSLISDDLLARLSFEAGVLARLKHPGIAQIHEAGVHHEGEGAPPQPFFVMELVEGVSVTQFAAAKELDTRDRLALLIRILLAVQHAHEKGVIHRDLKPANILVEASGQPKVLDFGVARLTDGDVQMTQMHTTLGAIVGTIRYMSPEQLGTGDVSSHDIDTRSDVYALGVIAYELLAGRLPYDLPSETAASAIKVIEQGEVIPLGRVNRELRGDIECIIMKALAHDRGRRYNSAAEFADDLQRFLSNEPVGARPATTIYQIRKFARRNRPLVGGVLATIIALTAGILLYAREAHRARFAAESATQSAAKAKAVSDFLVSMLARIDPNRQSENIDVAELVERAAVGIDSAFADQPIEQAAVRNEVGTIFYNLGKYEKACREYELALQLRKQHLGEMNEDTLDSMNNLGQAKARLGLDKESLQLYRSALDGRTKLLGETHAKTLISLNNLAMSLQGAKEFDEAEKLIRRCIDAQVKAHGEINEATLVSMQNLATLLRLRKQFVEAEAVARRAADGMMKLYGQDHALTRMAQTHLARMLRDLDRDEEAEPLYRNALTAIRKTLGDHHRDTAVTAHNYAQFLAGKNRPAEAAPNYRLALDIYREQYGPDHRDVLNITSRLAEALNRSGSLDDARQMYEQFLQASRRVNGERHERTIAAMKSMADLCRRSGLDDEAASWQAQIDLAKSER